jgi:formylglycine-generating enzyme required for sulfatase activity
MWPALVATLALAVAPSQSHEGDLAVVPGPLEGMEFVRIPAGAFLMGNPDSSCTEECQLPQHEVSVRPFELMTTEVTQGMWIELMGDNPSSMPGDLRRPVESVSWDDCQVFISRLNELDPDHCYRLPTEAEWEYACRAGSTTAYYWGDELDPAYCWWFGNSPETTHPVGTSLPNAFGLFDMSGNVWEWCDDFFHYNYEGAPTDGSSWGEEPWGWDRVIRGGGIGCFYEESYRSSMRIDCATDKRYFDHGLRVARDPG